MVGSDQRKDVHYITGEQVSSRAPHLSSVPRFSRHEVLMCTPSHLCFRAHFGAISNCCFTFSGHFLCTSSWDKTLKIWNVHTGEFRNSGACATLMKGHEGSVSSCHFSRDSE